MAEHDDKVPTVQVRLDPGWVRRSALGVIVLLAVFMVFLWAWKALGDFLFLLLLAWLLGLAIDPIVTRLHDSWGWPRGLGTMFVFIMLGVFAAVFFVAFGQLFASQITSLVQAAPSIVQNVIDWLNARFNLGLDPATIKNQLNLTPQTVGKFASQAAGGVLGVLSSAIGVVFQGFTLLLFAFYFAADGPRLRKHVASLLPTKQQAVFHDVWQIATDKAGGFVISRLGLAGISALFSGLFFIIIGLDYWLPLALWMGLISQFIPTVGTYLAVALPGLIAVLSDQPLDAVWVIIFATVYQQIENYYFAPRISARTMDIHPAVAFGSVIAGAALFGPIGALIGIPVAAAVLAFAQVYTRRYELIPELEDDEESETQPA
ncbi:MAG: AI-2E family transporter [Micrococcales bacterium]|nr:AI-2E family transporter [Micrococcales bacterium]